MSLEEKLNRLFEGFGYQKFKMSKFEEYDLYALNKDFLTSSQLITFTDLDGKLMALKPDITLSIVKSTTAPRKVYYNEMVYRAKDHHYREIPQAGVECIGPVDAYLEAEVIALAANALETIDKNYILRISDAGFLKALLEDQQIDEQYQAFILDAMDHKNADYLRALEQEGVLNRQLCSTLINLIDLYLPLSQGAKEVKNLVRTPACVQMMDHLQEIAKILKGFEVENRIFLDFSLVNSMDYYNGIVFQGALSGIPFTVLSGGRYDRLPQKMGKSFGAVGFAVYMDIVENQRHSRKSFDGDILIRYQAKDTAVQVARIVQTLRRQGKTVRAISDGADWDSSRWRKVLSVKEAGKEAGL
ncbi:MAG: ATP phosphoribosyltransferase regulatory subunit [Solobacterium sp.]|nr:ATP phosphoribosyltransferase regulatory subunit [Solobacterium sp.]